MEKFRSMSCREGKLQLESHNNGGIEDHHQNKANSSYPSSMQDLRSFSSSYPQNSTHVKAKKNQIKTSHHDDSKSSRRWRCSSSKGGGWSLTDPELQRMKRVASYKAYDVEGKMKGSFRKSFRWIKNTCSHVVHGFW